MGLGLSPIPDRYLWGSVLSAYKGRPIGFLRHPIPERAKAQWFLYPGDCSRHPMPVGMAVRRASMHKEVPIRQDGIHIDFMPAGPPRHIRGRGFLRSGKGVKYWLKIRFKDALTEKKGVHLEWTLLVIRYSLDKLIDVH